MQRHIVMRMIVVAAMLVFFRPAVLAQQTTEMGSSPAAQRADRVEARLQQLTEALNLTDDQKAKVTPLLADEIKQIREVRADTSLAPRDRLARIRDIRQATDQQLRALLTPEQQQKLDALRRQGRRGRAANPQARLQHLATQLDLTDEQKNQIAPILQNEFQLMQQVRADTSLTRRARFAKVRKIQQETHQAIWPLLTAEQQQTLDQIRQDTRERLRGRSGRRGGGPAPI